MSRPAPAGSVASGTRASTQNSGVTSQLQSGAKYPVLQVTSCDSNFDVVIYNGPMQRQVNSGLHGRGLNNEFVSYSDICKLYIYIKYIDVFAATSIVTLYVTVKVQSTAARMRVTFDFMPPLLGFVTSLNAKYPSSARIRLSQC